MQLKYQYLLKIQNTKYILCITNAYSKYTYFEYVKTQALLSTGTACELAIGAFGIRVA